MLGKNDDGDDPSHPVVFLDTKHINVVYVHKCQTKKKKRTNIDVFIQTTDIDDEPN